METVKRPYRWAKGRANRALKIDFVRFCMVGAVGFTLTAITLHIFHGIFDLPIILATVISAEVGLLSNFVFHERWTYKHADHQNKSLGLKFLHFHMSSWTGVVILTALESVGVEVLKLNYFVSLIGAAGITLFWNFLWTKYYIFKGHTPAVLLHPEEIVANKK